MKVTTAKAKDLIVGDKFVFFDERIAHLLCQDYFSVFQVHRICVSPLFKVNSKVHTLEDTDKIFKVVDDSPFDWRTLKLKDRVVPFGKGWSWNGAACFKEHVITKISSDRARCNTGNYLNERYHAIQVVEPTEQTNNTYVYEVNVNFSSGECENTPYEERLIEEAKDAARAGVQRTLTAWPFGKILEFEVSREERKLKAFWKKEE